MALAPQALMPLTRRRRTCSQRRFSAESPVMKKVQAAAVAAMR